MTQPSPDYVRIQRLISRVLDPSAVAAMNALLPIIQNKEPITMADIQTALADLDTAVKGVAERSASDVAALQAQITDLQAKGVDTAALQAIADSIEGNVAKLNSIDPVADVPAEEPTDPGTEGDTPTV